MKLMKVLSTLGAVSTGVNLVVGFARCVTNADEKEMERLIDMKVDERLAAKEKKD